MESKTVVKDPVCCMEIETATAAGHTEHAGQTYYSCGPKFKERFDHDPAQYLIKSADKPKSGHRVAVNPQNNAGQGCGRLAQRCFASCFVTKPTNQDRLVRWRISAGFRCRTL